MVPAYPRLHLPYGWIRQQLGSSYSAVLSFRLLLLLIDRLLIYLESTYVKMIAYYLGYVKPFLT